MNVSVDCRTNAACSFWCDFLLWHNAVTNLLLTECILDVQYYNAVSLQESDESWHNFVSNNILSISTVNQQISDYQGREEILINMQDAG